MQLTVGAATSSTDAIAVGERGGTEARVHVREVVHEVPDVVREIVARYDARTGEAAVFPPLWSRLVAANCCFQIRIRAEVAQLVEHTTENRGVAGPSPALGTILKLS